MKKEFRNLKKKLKKIKDENVEKVMCDSANVK